MDVTVSGLLPELLMLGIPEVDAQHDAIFCRIEQLKFRSIDTNVLDPDGMADLLNYLGMHFATEERLAGEAGLDFADHAKQHADTLQVLGGWSRQVLSGRYDLYSFLRYLEVWFERHIREEDSPFARQFKAVAGAGRASG